MAEPVEIRKESGTEVAAVREAAKAEGRRLNRLQATSETVIAIAIVLVIIRYAELPLVVLLVSMLLAFMLAPLVDLLEKLRLPRSAGGLIATVLLVAALYGGFYVSFTKAQSFADELPKYSGEIKRMLVHVRQKAEKIEKTTEGVLPPAEGAARGKQAVAIQPSSPLDKITSNFGSVSETVLIVSFIPFLVYFMLSWQRQVHARSVLLFSKENRQTAYVTMGLISSMIRSFIVGNVIVGVFMGTISVVVFGLLGLPYFYFIGYISGFLSLVPYVGVLLALVPPIAAGLGYIHSTELAIILVTVFALHLLALNVLYPKFLGSRLKLNPLAVTLALLFWGWMWGAMGLVLAIPMTGALKIVLDQIEPLQPYGEWLGE